MALKLSNVLKHIKKTNTCWIWVGSKGKNGYGHYAWSPGYNKPVKATSAHRVVYELLVGSIPDGRRVSPNATYVKK